jgi:Mor family transcriptional regulator
MQEDTKRNEQLVKDKKRGMTYRELERKYNISQNTITRIVYRYRIKEQLKQAEQIVK